MTHIAFNIVEPLDFEAQSFYEFDVIVSDGGSSPVKITMVIDVINVNEHPPIFSPGQFFNQIVAVVVRVGVFVVWYTKNQVIFDFDWFLSLLVNLSPPVLQTNTLFQDIL